MIDNGDRELEVLQLLVEALKERSRLSQAEEEDLEGFFTEQIAEDKAKGTPKKDCFIKGKYVMHEAVSAGHSKRWVKQADEVYLRALNKVYSDEPAISSENQIETAFDCLRDILIEEKQSGVTKETWQKRAASDYLEAISQGKDKKGCHEALERVLKIIEEVYAE